MLRKPSEYLPAALAGLRRRLMPDSTLVLRHDGHSSAVTRVGSPARGEDAIAGGEVAEGIRVLASAADFPRLSRGSLVERSGAPRIVTSARSDPALATLSIGLSASLEKCRVSYSGTRRDGGAVHSLRFPLDVLAVETEDIPMESESAAAPFYGQTWTLAVPKDIWPEVSPPRTGDTAEFVACPRDADGTIFAVASVVERDGHFILHVRPRGVAKW